MFRPYIIVFSALLIANSSNIAAQSWEEEQHDISTSLGLNQSDNLYNSLDQKESAEYLFAGFDYDWLGLYEGFGVNLPFSVRSRYYQQQSQLNGQDYELSPALKLFLADAVDLTLNSHLSSQQLIAGNGAAEFVDRTKGALTAEQKSLFAVLQLGRAPDKQHLQLQIGHEINQQHLQHQLLTELSSNVVRAEYAHRITENSALLLHSEYREEQQGFDDSRLRKIAGGWSGQWVGRQQFSLLAGYFNRINGQDEQTGLFWQLNNRWQLTQSWQLALSSSRLSVLSYASNSVSQLDTLHAISVEYAYSSAHQIGLTLAQRHSQLDTVELKRSRLEAGLHWLWQLNDRLQSRLQLQQARQQDQAESSHQRHELFWQLSWSW